MDRACPECRAPLDEGRTCVDAFHELLALEWRVPEPGGRRAHFLLVATYRIQHPDAMRLAPASDAWLRRSLAAVLAGEATTDELRAQAGASVDGAGRLQRRDLEPVPTRVAGRWTMTVADVLTAGERGFRDAVVRWAATTLGDLERGGRSVSRHDGGAEVGASSRHGTASRRRRRT